MAETARQEVATIVGYLVFAAILLFGGSLEPASIGPVWSTILLIALFVVMLWLAFSVVRHAEGLATLLGEPYGTLILTLSVIGIEVALIASVMIAGGDGKSALARDTMFSVVMIVLNGLIGLSLLVGGLRHRLQHYNLIGASSYLAVLIPIAVLSLILPRFTQSAPGGELSIIQSVFLIVMSIGLYGIFLAIQVVTHSDIFMQPSSDDEGSDAPAHHHHEFVIRSVPFHSIGLIAAMLPIVLLSKTLATYISYGIGQLGAPLALGGFLIAALVLTPEGISAVQAARDNQLQRAVNLCFGSALATIGMTVPAVLAIGWIFGLPVELGLDSPEIVLLSVTLMVSIVTFLAGRTNMLFGAVHLSLFAAYLMLIFDTA